MRPTQKQAVFTLPCPHENPLKPAGSPLAGFFFSSATPTTATTMLAISRTGTLSVAQAIDAVRDVPARVIPYAAATALTRSVMAARDEVRQVMPQVFDHPVPYTLNALRVEPATADKLTARLAVKDQAGGRGTRPESYLLPSVEAGGRAEKRFERALRYAGVLAPGWRAVAGRDAPLDEYGNLPPTVLRRILTSVTAGRSTAAAPYFVHKGKGQPGIYARAGGRTVKPVLIFTAAHPQYAKRLDFSAISRRRAEADFPAEFARAASAILARRR